MHYVIGDIHGYFDELMSLIHTIEKEDPAACFILTGDLVDRGPKVMETLVWAMENIRPDGRFQCVLGNHEDMILKWYERDYLPWAEQTAPDYPPEQLPPTRYDFSDILAAGGLTNPPAIQPFINFFGTLPLYLTLRVCTSAGKVQDYAIAHGWYQESWLKDPELTPDQRRRNIIWEREAIGCGCPDDHLIVVHGHTPTVERECEEKYYLSKDPEPINPGLIAYRRNAINLDGGRPYKDIEGRFCTISAICLETLREYFADAVPEDYPYIENKYQKELKKKILGC